MPKHRGCTMEIREQIRRYISENLLFSDDDFPYDDDSSFLKNGVVDSTGVMELVSYVEKEFGIVVQPHESCPTISTRSATWPDTFRGKRAETGMVSRIASVVNPLPRRHMVWSR